MELIIRKESPQNKKKNRRRWGPWGTAMIGWRGGLTTRPPPLCNEEEETADWLRIFSSSSSSTKRRIRVEAMFLFSPLFSSWRASPESLQSCWRCVPVRSAFLCLPRFISFQTFLPDRERERKKRNTIPFFVRLLPYLVRLECGPLAVFAGDLNARLVNLPPNGIQIGLT